MSASILVFLVCIDMPVSILLLKGSNESAEQSREQARSKVSLFSG